MKLPSRRSTRERRDLSFRLRPSARAQGDTKATDLQRAAAASGEGRLVYIDSRVPETVDPVAGEDIIGWFRVRDGRIVDGSYLPNPNHKIEGQYGFTAVLGGIRQALLSALLARNAH